MIKLRDIQEESLENDEAMRSKVLDYEEKATSNMANKEQEK